MTNLNAVWKFLFLAQTTMPGGGVGQSAGAGSPFSDYDVGIVAYVFLIGVLVSVLLIGAFLFINLGLLSKRPQDKEWAHRTPADLGVLKTQLWPEEPFQKNILPAEETDEEPKEEKKAG